MRKKIKIVLKSDLCASSGESLGSLVDTDICYDSYGLIYIPSKRLKGLLRESFVEYKEWANSDELPHLNTIENRLFGKEGDNSPCDLKIDNAYLKDAEKVQNDIENIEEKYKKYLFKQRIINASTYIRYQTAIDIETGVAKDNSLRTTRVIEKGTEFYADIECTEEEINIIEKCLKLITHVGMNRTRGYGEVLCCLVEEDKQEIEEINYSFLDDSNYKIELLLKADSNIMVSKQNSEISEDYIPGSNIMGSIANKYIKENNIELFENISEEFRNLFLNGQVKYSNAYITEKNGNVKYYPAPLSFSKIKNKSGEYRNKMLDVNETDIQLTNLNNSYVTLEGENFIKEVKLIEHYHHQRDKDLRVGHVSKSADGGTFYQFTSIDMNQYFLSNIELKGKYAKKIINYIRKGDILRVGKSKTAEYGKLSIKDVKISEIKEECTKNCHAFAAILTSPVILFDKENAKMANDKDSLIKELKKLFGDGNLKVKKSFIGYSDEGGYNAIWNLAKEQLPSYEKGTTICFESENGINLKEEYWIGLRQNEGYGKLKIFNIPENMDSKLELTEYKNKAKELIKYEDLQEMTKKILRKTIKNVVYEEIQDDVFHEIQNQNISLNNTTIERILLMLKESSSKEEFIKNVNGIKDNKKLNKVLQIINNDSNVFEMESYKDYSDTFDNNNIPEDDKNKFLLEYIKQFLAILKIKGGENNDN